MRITPKNYDKFILKGSLALEMYYDVNINEDREKYIIFNEKLSKYRSLKEKNLKDKENMVKYLVRFIENLGIDKFTLYDDGDVEYNFDD